MELSIENILSKAESVKMDSSHLTFEMQVETFIERLKNDIKSNTKEDIDASILGLTRLHEQLIKEKGEEK